MPAPLKRYPIPGARHRVEDEIKGSRFITTIGCASTVLEARAFVRSIRDEFPDASHNCWAHVSGSPGSTEKSGAGDDGEPGGTAGRPMLRVLLGAGVGDVVVVVTRYFGGVKLGRGGLVRAYTLGVQHVLGDMPLAERRILVTVRVVIPYAFVDAVRRLLQQFEAEVAEENFETEAEIVARVPIEHATSFEKAVLDATAGAARISRPPGPPNEA